MWAKRLNYGFSNLERIYGKMVSKASKTEDPVQLNTIRSLQRLNDDLIEKHPIWKQNIRLLGATLQTIQSQSVRAAPKQSSQPSFGGGLFDSLFGANQTPEEPIRQKKETVTKEAKLRPDRVKGLYLWGSSGCGKTFLSQLFFDNLQIKEKKKVHFHQFMAGIHRELFLLQRAKKTYDPLTTIAFNKVKESRLLFLDEFQVTDVADATMVKRLFEKMINNGLVLLATSNRQPSQLYKNGIQREHFLPFIPFLEKNCKVEHMKTDTDYRYLLKSDPKYSFLSPVTPETDLLLDQMFIELTGTRSEAPEFKVREIEVIEGRKLKVPRSRKGVCMYMFDQLCNSIMGDSDFRAICRNHRAIIIKHIPLIDLGNRNVANRFIKLLDQIYNNKVKLYCNAETSINQLTRSIKPEQAVSEEEFAINRCKSRLVQLQSQEYKDERSYWELLNKGLEETQ